MVRPVVVLLLLVGLATACSGSSRHRSLPVGSSTHSLQSGGVQRTYRLYRPATLPRPAALVLVLHGGFGSGRQAETTYGWDALADREHFLVAYPDGLHRAWAVGGGCCGESGRTGVDDVGFVEQLVKTVERDVSIDTRRIYATGISNGGLLAYRLACDTATFAAIGPVAATLLGPCATPAPTSVIHIHGTADERIRYVGGRGTGVAHIDGPSVPSLIATWRSTDRCAPATIAADGAVTTSTATCPAGRAVELITVAGAGHQWPGSPSRPVLEKLLGLDPPSRSLDATTAIWRFFAAHPRAS